MQALSPPDCTSSISSSQATTRPKAFFSWSSHPSLCVPLPLSTSIAALHLTSVLCPFLIPRKGCSILSFPEHLKIKWPWRRCKKNFELSLAHWFIGSLQKVKDTFPALATAAMHPPKAPEEPCYRMPVVASPHHVISVMKFLSVPQTSKSTIFPDVPSIPHRN